ncbi:hypothetical protein KJ671_03695 [Patescibacteria group bacterium]|nr:hypothetical protein [Patescibacteria group bacterium]
MKFTEIKMQIPKYSPEEGIKFKWEDHFTILVKKLDNEILIQCNKEGLISLAKIFLTLSQNSVPNKEHIHLDETNSLEKGSCGIIIEKFNDK